MRARLVIEKLFSWLGRLFGQVGRMAVVHMDGQHNGMANMHNLKSVPVTATSTHSKNYCFAHGLIEMRTHARTSLPPKTGFCFVFEYTRFRSTESSWIIRQPVQTKVNWVWDWVWDCLLSEQIMEPIIH